MLQLLDNVISLPLDMAVCHAQRTVCIPFGQSLHDLLMLFDEQAV